MGHLAFVPSLELSQSASVRKPGGAFTPLPLAESAGVYRQVGSGAYLGRMTKPHGRWGGAGEGEAQIDLDLDDEGWIIAKSAGGVTQLLDAGRKRHLFPSARSRAETRMSATGPQADLASSAAFQY